MSTATHRLVSRAVLALFLACAKSQVPPAPEVEVKLPIAGLWTNPNDFDAPPGSCEVLDNMTQDRPGIWEPRRGFGLVEVDEDGKASITGPINEGATFRGQIIVHHATSSISRWTGTAWSTYSGTFTPPASAASGRVRFYESAQSLFVTTSAGVMELDSPTGTWRLTGCPKALDGTATLRRTVNETGFATANGQWAYRFEWGFKNANGRLQIGPPSGRMLVQSPATVIPTTAHVAKLNGSTTVTVTSTTHGYVTGEYVDVTLGGVETWFAAGTFQITRVSDTSFTYSDALNNASGGTVNPAMPITYGFTAGRNVNVTVPIPTGITSDNFVLVFRSGKSASATSEPSDQMAQVYERSPTNLEITAGSMSIPVTGDLTPDDFRGDLLDVSAETVLAAKYRPPACADMAEFHNVTWCAATKGVYACEFQFISIGGTYGLQSSVFLVFSPSPTNLSAATWTVSVESASAESDGAFKLFTTGSAAQNIADTARSFVRAINASTTNSKLSAEYISGDAEAPGKVRVYARSPTTEQFAAFVSVSVGGVNSGGAFIPYLPTYCGTTNMARAGTTVTVNTSAPHNFTSGQLVDFQYSDNTSHFPNGQKTVTVVDPDTFTYTEAGSTVVAEVNAGSWFTAPVTDVLADIIERADRLAFSLPDQPWSVPLPNEYFVEGKPATTSAGPTIFRIIPNRDSLLVWADVGLSQITGFYPNFALTKLQSPLKMLAPEMAATQGTPGVSYALTDTGVVGVITAPQPVSTPIQNIFQDLQANAPAALKNYAFAVAYPSAFKVLFFLPEASTDTGATNAYVLHTRTGDWSRWDVDATCGWVDAVTDTLYLGRSDGLIWAERKTGALLDYKDPSQNVYSAGLAYTGRSGQVLSTGAGVSANFQPGDEIEDVVSGGHAVIKAVTSSTMTIVGNAANFSSFGGTLKLHGVAISSTVQPTRWFGKEGPDVDKDVDSGWLYIQPPQNIGDFTKGAVSFRNDYNPTFSTPEVLTLDSVMTSQVPFKIPPDMQRSGWVQMKMTHAPQVTERYRLLGYSLLSRTAGPKDGY